MTSTSTLVGTVISDETSPTFEMVRIKLKAGHDVKPGTLVQMPIARAERHSYLIGRINSAYEHNPHESAEGVNVRDTLGIPANYPRESENTTIYRLAEAELIEELIDGQIISPQTLPESGSEVRIASDFEIVQALGLEQDSDAGLEIGATASGSPARIVLKRESIQRHVFIGGTTGSGKSYAMGVLAEEIIKHNLPMVFIDTQDEYSTLVQKLGGHVLTPGKDFTIRISSLASSELLALLPGATTDLQRDIVDAAFSQLSIELISEDIARFNLDQLIERMELVGPELTNDKRSIPLAISRTRTLAHNPIFGNGHAVADWRRFMYPCMSINCKKLTTSQLQPIATAVLRELQSLRLRNHIPPYVAVIDEAHLFVPEGEGSACKQIIREGVRIGRHHGISMILMTQSPVDIDKRAIRQCNTRLVFALEPDQLDAIRGVKSDASEEMLNALPKMQRGTCLLSGTYETVKHAVPVAIRPRRLRDSEGGATPDVFSEMAENWIPLIDELNRNKRRQRT